MLPTQKRMGRFWTAPETKIRQLYPRQFRHQMEEALDPFAVKDVAEAVE
jgi:hypothetical protein